MIRSRAYQSAPAPSQSSDRTNPRVKLIQQTLDRYRTAARRRLLKEFPEIDRDLRTILQASR